MSIKKIVTVTVATAFFITSATFQAIADDFNVSDIPGMSPLTKIIDSTRTAPARDVYGNPGDEFNPQSAADQKYLDEERNEANQREEIERENNTQINGQLNPTHDQDDDNDDEKGDE